MYSIKDLAKLQKRSFRNKQGVFLIEGKKIIEEAVESGQEITQVIATESFTQRDPLYLAQLTTDNRQLTTLISDSNAERLTSSKTPAGIFAVVKKKKTSFEDLLNKKFIVVFEDVKDPGNLGTMIRTADWFGADAIITTVNGADPYNDKVLRSTMGSIFHLPMYLSENLVKDLTKLKSNGFHLTVTRPEKNDTNHKSQITKHCVILGNESLGTSLEVDALADSSFSIPQFGKAESLNVAVSFGIVMWEMVK